LEAVDSHDGVLGFKDIENELFSSGHLAQMDSRNSGKHNADMDLKAAEEPIGFQKIQEAHKTMSWETFQLTTFTL